MGMALDEPEDGSEKLESNGITAYISSGLYEHISRSGDICIDFGTDRFGTSGYSIRIRGTSDDSSNCC